MTKTRLFVAGAVIASFTAGALAQQLTSQTLTGNEVWTAGIGTPQGTAVYVTSGQIRGTQGYVTTSSVSGTISLANTTNVLITTAAVSGAMTVNTPTQPWDGEILIIANNSGSANTATVTLTASAGQTVNGGAVATQANASSAEWRYVLASTTWYRIR